MKRVLIFLLMLMTIIASACSQQSKANEAEKNEVNETKKNEVIMKDNGIAEDESEISVLHNELILIEGGTFANAKSSYYGEEVTIDSFYMSKFEVTQHEWMTVMGSNPSGFAGANLPVEMVSWYDVIAYCNERSIQEGLEPYYNIDKKNSDPDNKSEYDPIKWTVTINKDANGYRLPTEAEWEYAASGGAISKGYTYSGNDDVEVVAWYWRNAGNEYLSGDWNWPKIENNRNTTKTVGSKEPNELGLYDMSGNVREWVWDWYEDVDIESGIYRGVKGGGWIGDVSNNEVSFRGKFEASGFGPDQGFRVSRSSSSSE